MGEATSDSRVRRFDRPARAIPSQPAYKRWFGQAKRGLGYYRLRSRLREPRFMRTLRDRDVFLVGHPKSGNTWLAYMLALVLSDDGADINLYNVGDYVPHVHGRDYRIAEFSHLPDPRIFRNEYPQHADRYPKTIYLVRDPRAALVSLWHMYLTLFDDRDMSLRMFVDRYLTRSDPFTFWNKQLVRWDRQVITVMRRAERDDSLHIVRYEDLVRDRARELRRIERFVGFSDDELDAGNREGRLARAVERGAFQAMQRLEDRHGAEAYVGRAQGTGRFVRRGRVDGWKDEMSPEVARRIEAEFATAMALAGYTD